MKKSRLQHPVVRHLNFIWQALLVYWLVGMFWIIPLRHASNIGGYIARTLGPNLGISRRAWNNLSFAMPEKTDTEKQKIILDMWDNLGRVAAESAHFKTIQTQDYLEVEGFENVEKAIADKRPVMMLTGHFSNWEVGPMACLSRGIVVATVYRPPNNPYVDALIRFLRRPVSPNIFPKGPEGARGIMRWLRQAKAVGLLVDQKMNEGIPIPFFGRDVMTVHAPAQMALMTNAAIIMVSNVRLENNHFKLTFSPELTSDETNPSQERVVELTTKMNQFLEKHIREYPGQWLWLHRRWSNIDKTNDEGDIA